MSARVEVPDALLRIAHNAYSTRIACGKQIETGRLEAARLGRLIVLRISRNWIRRFAQTFRKKYKEKKMLYTVCVVLIVLWALGMVSSYTMGGLVHLLLVVALIGIVLNLVQGRRALN